MAANTSAGSIGSSGSPATLRQGPAHLLPAYFGLAVALAVLPLLLHFGLAAYDESVFTKQTQPAWSWPRLEQDLYEFYGNYRRWPHALDEFYNLGKKWTQDPLTKESRIRHCRAAPCTALSASNYLYLYRALPNGAAALWMLPQVKLPTTLPYSYRARPESVSQQALAWQVQAPAYFAACLPGRRCRLWQQPGALVNEKERPLGRSVFTPQQVVTNFEPTAEWLGQSGFIEIKPSTASQK